MAVDGPAGSGTHSANAINPEWQHLEVGDAVRLAPELALTVTVDVVPAADVGGIDQYHAVVLGSAIYMGRWLEDARKLADRFMALAPRPLWLFSSGPIGDPPKPDEEPAEVADMIKTTNARGHRLFPGRLDRHRLGIAEKAVIMALRVPDGDFLDWDAIHAWGAQIAEELNHSAEMPGRPVTEP